MLVLSSICKMFSMFLILLSLQASYNVSMLGLGVEYKKLVFKFFITGIILFGLSL